ncbi:MAG: hypothetical protein H7832_07190 [Magnetococcus sp. DMHC-6]
MNKITPVFIIFGIALAATSAWATEAKEANPTQENYQAICEKYAKEDQIAPDQIADYIAQCFKDLGGNADDPLSQDQMPYEEDGAGASAGQQPPD